MAGRGDRVFVLLSCSLQPVLHGSPGSDGSETTILGVAYLPARICGRAGEPLRQKLDSRDLNIVSKLGVALSTG